MMFRNKLSIFAADFRETHFSNQFNNSKKNKMKKFLLTLCLSLAALNTFAGNPDSLSVSQYNRLGQPASHGCIRLCVADARWIYENCAGTSSVYLFTSNEPAPFDRPAPAPAIQLRGDYGHDPTDV